MAGSIKPTSVEGYLIRLYDTCEHLNTRFAKLEKEIAEISADKKESHQALEKRMSNLESRITKAESQNLGAKDVKSSITPYVIAFLSALFAMVGYLILHFVGIK